MSAYRWEGKAMTLTVDLTAEEEAQLSKAAAQLVLEISEYARRLLIEELAAQAHNGDTASEAMPFYLRTSAKEWKRALEEWSQTHSTTTPLISDALRRENMYQERE